MIYDSVYGNYRTRKFTDIWDAYEVFFQEFKDSPFKDALKDESIKLTFYLLYSQYGNSHIANADENQFKYKLFSIMFMVGPTWEKRLEVQKILRDLSEDELILGAKQIHNHAFNPGTAPGTSTLEELTTINDQNTSSYKRSKLEAYTLLWDLLKLDVSKIYVKEFKNLFLAIVEPQEPLWYITERED